jgi:cell division protein FtsL
LAVPRYNRYQYETSPRKLEPEYSPVTKKYPKKSVTPRNRNKTKNISKASIIRRKDQFKLIAAVLIVFSAVLTMSYRNSQIDESFSKTEELKEKYMAIEKENDQMKVDIENSLNYNNVEQQAKELLGMQKLSNKQTVYVNLPKKDYIQPATETVVIEKNDGFINTVINKFKSIF